MDAGGQRTFCVFDLTRSEAPDVPLRVSGRRPDVAWFRAHMCAVPPADAPPDRVLLASVFAAPDCGATAHRKPVLEWLRDAPRSDDAPIYIMVFRQHALQMVFLGTFAVRVAPLADITPSMLLSIECHAVRGHIHACSLTGVTPLDAICARAWIDATPVGSENNAEPNRDNVDSEEDDDDARTLSSHRGRQTLWEALACVQSTPERATMAWLAGSLATAGASEATRRACVRKWIVATMGELHGLSCPRTVQRDVPIRVSLLDDAGVYVAWHEMATTWSFPHVTLVPRTGEHVRQLELASWNRLWTHTLAPAWQARFNAWASMLLALPPSIVAPYRAALHHIVVPYVQDRVMRHMEDSPDTMPWLKAATQYTWQWLEMHPAWNAAVETCRLTAAPIRSGGAGDATSGVALERMIEELDVTVAEADALWHGPMSTLPEFLCPMAQALLEQGELKDAMRLHWATLITAVARQHLMRSEANTSTSEVLQCVLGAWFVYVGARAPPDVLTRDRIQKLVHMTASKWKRCLSHEKNHVPGMQALSEACGDPPSFWTDMSHWQRCI